jgi:hypothetical protein
VLALGPAGRGGSVVDAFRLVAVGAPFRAPRPVLWLDALPSAAGSSMSGAHYTAHFTRPTSPRTRAAH